MENSMSILDIISEVAWQTNNGLPDFNDPKHVRILELVLRSCDLPESEVKRSIQNLREAAEDAKKDDKYIHMGKGVYVKQGQEKRPDATKYEKTDDGKYTEVEGEEGGEDNREYTKDMLSTPEPGSDAAENGEAEKKRAAKAKAKDLVGDTSTGPTSQQLKNEADKKSFLKDMVSTLLKQDETVGIGAGRFNMSREDLTIYQNYLNGDTPDVPSYNISNDDIDTVMSFVKEANPTYFKSLRERLRKKGDPPKEFRTGEAGSNRIRAVLKHYLQTGGISTITGERVAFNESQLDHKVSLDNGGKDEPANWEFMEARFNQFKGALENDAIMKNIQQKLSRTPEQERAKQLEIELKQFSKIAMIEYWDDKFKTSGDHGLTDNSIDSMNKKQLDYLVKGWNKTHPTNSDFYIARYKESDDRASGRAGGGRPISRGDLITTIKDVMRGAGLDIPTVAESEVTDQALDKIMDQIERKKADIKALKAKK